MLANRVIKVTFGYLRAQQISTIIFQCGVLHHTEFDFLWLFIHLRPGKNVFKYLALLIIITWLAPWAGKMNQIARSDWLPERARWSHLARSGLPAVSRMKNFSANHIILLTKFVRRDIGLVLFCEFMGLDFVSVHKQAKKRTRPISSHLDRTNLVNNPYVHKENQMLNY